MTEEPMSRRDRLIAAALAGDLSGEEQREFDLACAADPGMLTEYRALREVSDRLAQSGLDWEEPDLPPGLASRVFAATSGDSTDHAVPTRPSTTADPQLIGSRPAGRRLGGTRPTNGRRAPRSRVAFLGLAAAGLLILGGLGGSAVSALLQAPPEGPPGALGAVEEVTFPTIPDGTSFDAALVAHTWGTETVLEVDGLAEGEIFEVILVSEDGAELTSGTFFGAEQTITCRMNAALMREDVSQLQIRDASGSVVVSSSVPDV
ncbi:MULTISPECIES: hypothetical protein [unclassified Arthrobacter]|uniref:hypothetical protein n=1 Tax=unclassified Arthrobacter TaxID=235627 RepID=UPI001492EDB2|nr:MULTISPECIES: hypothetical protein [unclassified Arthrobacter]MBE0010408.1 hypothetical protein [Arthrobacter sp. AET 35A]NOJ64269.1 hypothetical protein [Arthrobacter sp. 147(2020)]